MATPSKKSIRFYGAGLVPQRAAVRGGPILKSFHLSSKHYFVQGVKAPKVILR